MTNDISYNFIVDISPFKYHHVCRNNTSLLCFHDELYLCICTRKQDRSECFGYDSSLDQCSRCLAGGRCLHGDRSRPNDFICLCTPCHSGRICQFNSDSFAFNLDQLLFTDLVSPSPTVRQTTISLLIIGPLILFLLGLINNLFSFVTFRRHKCLRNGIGQYLLYLSVVNQISIGVLAARLIHLSMTITGRHPHHHPQVLCKLLSYLLTCSGRIVYWLSSLVAIERVYVTLFLNGRWLNMPHIARRLIALTVTVVLTTTLYELLFVKSFSGIHDETSSMCVLQFPIESRSAWMIIHQMVTTINSVVPLLINICCMITISCVVTKKKMNTCVRDVCKICIFYFALLFSTFRIGYRDECGKINGTVFIFRHATGSCWIKRNKERLCDKLENQL